MNSRSSIRRISGSLSDVPGVRTVEVDGNAETVRVTGTAEVATLQAAIRRAGFDVLPWPRTGRTPGPSSR
jgi:hypothetical protein